ncbi:MAG: PAC2 family protein [Actinobacteria bacterium]|nr:PAC2 family protein [Actinomycetota bacterium]
MPDRGGREPRAVRVRGRRLPALDGPVVLAAFAGWNDAGEAATGALAEVRRRSVATPFADIDPEDFLDFQAVRPTVGFDEDGERRIAWPHNRFSWARLDGSDRHIVLLEGTEPNYRWRTFTDSIVDFARDLGAELVVTLGALQIDVPHTRAVPVTGSSSSPDVTARLGLRPSTYEGPTGIVGVLHQACLSGGLPAVSLWAGVPHYLAGGPYHAAALALGERIVGLVGADIALDGLARRAAAQRDEIGELVADDEDLTAYVAELERRVDAAPEGDPPDTQVSGEQLAAEFQRYLRDRGSER